MWNPKEICRFIDLTSLNTADSQESIEQFLNQAIEYDKKGFTVAAVCLFPNFGRKAVEKLENLDIKTAVVAGNFPNSQSFLSVRLHECELALDSGVDEIDIVINIGALLDKDYTQVSDEVRAFKNLIGNKKLKVILETGLLKDTSLIKKAAELAIDGGADFIKTSTGKDFPGADMNSVIAMSEVIASHYQTSNKRIGLKISGGVKTYSDAVRYFEKVESILGKDFMTPDLLRIGASSLVQNLMNE
jgi:deoxyribose-phosphate aldolase